MSIDEARKRMKEYFSDKIETFGATPQGADYNGGPAQEIRFAQLVKVINPASDFSVIDYGCGYGALYDFLIRQGWTFTYHGLDFNENMLAAARKSHAQLSDDHFTSRESDLQVADYVLAGSIFNNKFQAEPDEWTKMVVETLQRLDKLCTRGFSFNMLTQYSDPERMAQRSDLYFAAPFFFFDFCKRNFSRDVALLHDYGLYDFTILVRKDV